MAAPALLESQVRSRTKAVWKEIQQGKKEVARSRRAIQSPALVVLGMGACVRCAVRHLSHGKRVVHSVARPKEKVALWRAAFAAAPIDEDTACSVRRILETARLTCCLKYRCQREGTES